MTVSGVAPILVEITGQPTAWASAAASPNASGSIEATNVTCAAAYAAGMSATWPSKSDDILQTTLGNLPAQLCFVAGSPLRIARENDDEIISVTAHSAGGFDQICLSFPTCQARGVQHNTLAILHAPCGSQRRNAVSVYGGGFKLAGINAAINDAQARCGRSVAGFRQDRP